MDDQVVTVFNTCDCPKGCGLVRLRGQGRQGETVRIEGKCPNGHLVYFMTKVNWRGER